MIFRTITLAALIFSCSLPGMERQLSTRPVTATLFNFLPKQFIAALEQKQSSALEEPKPLIIPEQPKQFTAPEAPIVVMPEEPKQMTVMEQICNLQKDESIDPIERDEKIADLYEALSKKCQELIAIRPNAVIHYETYKNDSITYRKKAQTQREMIQKKQLREDLRPKIDALYSDETMEKQRRLCLTVKLLTQLKAATDIDTQEYEDVAEELAEVTLHQKRTIFKNQVAICRQNNCIPELCAAYAQLVDLYPHQRKYYELKLSEAQTQKQLLEAIAMARAELVDLAYKSHANDAAKFDTLACKTADIVPLYAQLKTVDLEMYSKFHKEQHLETIDGVRSLRSRQYSITHDPITHKQVEQYRALYAKTNQE
jgi:hypothetical protein